MDIRLLHVRDCPNHAVVRSRLEMALERTRVVAVVHDHEVLSSQEAARLGMRGSPTVLIDGRDPFADGADPAALACRLYRSGAGLSGAPSVEQLVHALTR